MKLSQLLKGIEIIEKYGERDPEIAGIKLDSRKVNKGDLFVAIPGFKDDGFCFIEDAKKRGAAAIITVKEWKNGKIASVRVADARKSLAFLSKNFYKNPDEKLQLFGITGTNGKTTTAQLLWTILGKSGRRASLLGTVKHNILGRIIDAANTTPEANDLYAFFRETADGGGDSAVMEVSSHALALGRVEGINFDVGVFTNLTHDHLDFHKDFDGYFQAKAKLFTEHLKQKGAAIINIDDERGNELASLLKKRSSGVKICTYGRNKIADVHPLSHKMSWSGIEMELSTPNGNMQVKSALSGFFNISNIMAAAAAALGHDIDKKAIAVAIEECRQVPGRFESIRAGQPFAVAVDYAHTPDALERLLSSARHLTNGRLIAVFGCGGDRDRKKRPVMGDIASRMADMAFVTSDNPRTEEPNAIIKEIMAGVSGNAVVAVETDRKKAIEKALSVAGKDDCVVIAGKGHEDYQIIGTQKFHFDDREIASEFIKGMKK